MTSKLKSIFLASGLAVLSVGVMSATAVAETPDEQSGSGVNKRGYGEGAGYGDGKRYGHRRHGRRGGRGMFRQNLTKDEFFAKMEERFTSIDANTDSVIDAEELSEFASKRRGRRGGRRGGRMLRRLDTNGDGTISKAEFSEQAEQRFARFDQNSDGRIDDSDRQAFREKRRQRSSE